MKKDFQAALECYADSCSRKETEVFFDKYWINSVRFEGFWKPLVNSAFYNVEEITGNNLRNNVDANIFNVSSSAGGLTLTNFQLEKIKAWAKLSGDECFAIIEHRDSLMHANDPTPLLRFEFPMKISWDELNSGGFVSLHLFGISCGSYFIAGESGSWLVQAANDLEVPVDTILLRKSVFN